MIKVVASRRTFLIGGLALGAAVACGTSSDVPLSSPSVVTEPPASPPPDRAEFLVRGSDGSRSVALTFHTNGDLRLAQQVLDITAARRAPMTCFIVGDWLEKNPSWAAKLSGAGHELANHTFSHPDVTELDASELQLEITKCGDVLARLQGERGRYFRPSGVDDGTQPPSELVLKTALACGYQTVLGFSDDPLDYKDPGSTVVVERTLASVRAGSIVSLHFGHPGTVDALPRILDGLAAKDLRPVTVSQLLGKG